MDPPCHPVASKARTEDEIAAEQDTFFLTGTSSCVQILGKGRHDFKASMQPSIPVLNEVVERKTCDKPVMLAPFKVPHTPLKPTIRVKPMTVLRNEEDLSTEELMKVVSRENEEKLAKMSQEEIEELKKDILDSLPEAFLDKLRH